MRTHTCVMRYPRGGSVNVRYVDLCADRVRVIGRYGASLFGGRG